MSDLVTLLTAVVLGFIHALEVDHMVAVTAFVSRRPALAVAARFGFRWGLGHTLAVLAAGTVLLVTGLRWSERYERLAETLVGLMLVGVGLWAIRATRNLHLHPPAEHGDHAHLHMHRGASARHSHSHDQAQTRRHAHGVTLVGLLHGLAGTSGVVALVPVTLMDRIALGFWYLLAFGVGVMAAMTLFALAAAMALRHAAERSVRWGHRLSLGAGLAGVAVGVWWILSAWES
jgi:ABC-type nickel/cobalt efflux system permease component RcnA